MTLKTSRICELFLSFTPTYGIITLVNTIERVGIHRLTFPPRYMGWKVRFIPKKRWKTIPLNIRNQVDIYFGFSRGKKGICETLKQGTVVIGVAEISSRRRGHNFQTKQVLYLYTMKKKKINIFKQNCIIYLQCNKYSL